jgi:hypothetical protein
MNHEDASLDHCIELLSELRQIATDRAMGVLEACDLEVQSLEGRLASARAAYVYHAVYNTPADVRGSIYR